MLQKRGLEVLSQPKGNTPRADRDSGPVAVRSGIRTVELKLVKIRSFPRANLGHSLEQADGVGSGGSLQVGF